MKFQSAPFPGVRNLEAVLVCSECCRKIGRLIFQGVTLRFFYFLSNFLSKISSVLSCHSVVVVFLRKTSSFFFRIKENSTKIIGFTLLW